MPSVRRPTSKPEEKSSSENKPRNHVILDATSPFTFRFTQFGSPRSITVGQRNDEETWPGGALWDIGVLLSRVLVMAAAPPPPPSSRELSVPRLRAAGLWPSPWRDCTVLELGCGVGLTGLVAALLGAKLVLLTDLEAVVRKATRPNVDRNRDVLRNRRVLALPLTWGDAAEEAACRRVLDEVPVAPPPRRRRKGRPAAGDGPVGETTTDPSLVLAGDVAYQHRPGAPSHFEAFASTLRKFATTRRTLVVFGTRMRMPASADLLEMLREDFEEAVEPVEAQEIDRDFREDRLGRSSNITLHFFRRKAIG